MSELPHTHDILMQEVHIAEAGPTGTLRLRSAPVPRPKTGELLIAVHAAGINRPDVLQRMGRYPVPEGASAIPGLEISGVVTAIGTDVQGFQIGDRVCALTEGGGYAEFCTVPASQTLALPPGLSYVQGAALPETLFTVWANLFMTARAEPGNTILIHGGSSGIGTTALSLCKALGIRTLTTTNSPSKADSLAALGAEVIISSQQDFSEAALALTDGHGVDAILDIVGGAYFDRNITALAPGGRLVIIGFLGGIHAKSANLMPLMMKRITVTGSTLRARSLAEKAAIATALKQHVWPLLQAEQCLPLIHATLPLHEAAAAHQMMESGVHTGKIVLTVSSHR